VISTSLAQAVNKVYEYNEYRLNNNVLKPLFLAQNITLWVEKGHSGYGYLAKSVTMSIFGSSRLAKKITFQV